MMVSAPFLSIVTPTYNRASLLGNCFASLLNQTDTDFEWIIVDDGSTDRTADVVSGFHTDLFSIRYIPKENGGKHTALNTAMPHIRGQYVLILDSDDALTEDAVASVRRGWEPHAQNRSVAMVTFLKGNAKNDPCCTVSVFGQSVDILRCRRIIRYGSDCCEVIRRDVFCQFPFPIFEGEGFLPECALWNRVARQYRCVYINQVIYLFRYLDGGLTRSGRLLRIRNPKGGMFICNLRMVPANYPLQRLKYGVLFCCYGFFAHLASSSVLKQTKYKALAAFCLLPGFLLYRYWNRKYLQVAGR